MKPLPSIREFVVAMLVMALGTPAFATDIALDSRATYLHVCQDAALNSPAIDLAAIGIAPGDNIIIEILGDFDNGPGGDTFVSSVAVFSSSSLLLAANLLHRVPDAIAAGLPVATANTFFCNEPTDIPEDFRIASAIPNTSVQVLVPAGATHVFVCPGDHYFQDNVDPDGDYAVRIVKAPVPVASKTWGAVKALYRIE